MADVAVVASVVASLSGAGAAGVSLGVCVVCETAGIVGMTGAVPMESSYTGSSGSGFGFAGAGLVVYELVTTGIWYEPGALAKRGGSPCAGESPYTRLGLNFGAGGGV